MRTCERCGDRLAAMARSDARFCSSRCRVAAHRERRRRRFPRCMTSRDRWLRWELAPRGGRLTKRPLAVSGRPGSSTDSATWSSFSAADASSVGSGLGFVLGDGIGCIDLDDCLDDGVLAPWARRIVDETPAFFVEVSQSGRGVHLFVRTHAAQGSVTMDVEGNRVEFYPSGRYIAVTGVPLAR